MTLNEFYNAVAKQADTDTLKIGAAETKRVLSEAFKILATLDGPTLADVVAKGLAKAKAKEKPPRKKAEEKDMLHRPSTPVEEMPAVLKQGVMIASTGAAGHGHESHGKHEAKPGAAHAAATGYSGPGTHS